MIYPDWLRAITRGNEAVFRCEEPVSVGVSGGQTSMLLRFLCREHGDGNQYYGFQNTGREHSQTYRFLQMAEACGLSTEWTEFRKPLVKGAPPKESRYEVVTPATAHRKGEPFRWMLETLAEFREASGRIPHKYAGGPARRVCSAYLKSKVAEKIAIDRWGHECYTTFIGFRADESVRIKKLKMRETARKSFECPLATIGITKEHVARFWSEQPFRLDCPENLGNCDLCFLKDQGDLAHNMAYEVSPESVRWWIDIQDEFGLFDQSKNYRRLLAEAPAREEIRAMLFRGETPRIPNGLTKRRFDLLVAQERRRAANGLQRMQCNCEASELITDEDVAAAGRDE